MSQGKNAEAIAGFDQALEADPGRIEARRYRAIVAGPPGRVGTRHPGDQPVSGARAPVGGDALRGRLRRRPSVRQSRHDRDLRPGARPPRARSGRRRGSGKSRRRSRPRRDPSSPPVPAPDQRGPGSAERPASRTGVIAIWQQDRPTADRCHSQPVFDGAQHSMPSTIPPSPEVLPDSLSHEVKALAVVLREEFDTPFRFYDSATGDRVVVPEQAEDGPAARARGACPGARTRRGAAAEGRRPAGEDAISSAFPWTGSARRAWSPWGSSTPWPGHGRRWIQEQSRLGKWIRSVHDRLRGAREMCDRRRSQAEQDRQSMIAWEAIMGLERLHRNLQIHKEPARNRGRILRVAGELLGVPSLAWVSVLEDGDVVLEGERLLSPWDCGQLADHLADQNLRDQSGYVLINEARESRWGARFPQIQNLLAVPVAEKTLVGLGAGVQQAASRRPRLRTAGSIARRRPRSTANPGHLRSCRSAARTRRSSCRSPPCSGSTCAPPNGISTSRTSWSG